jgi:DNA mismatch repair protein MutL
VRFPVALRIKILPENLTNKIAAGEVVERPASVVKELVENALDSGCREVVVEIEAGGRRLIKVADDGCGMSREDALLALERHATSKIETESDLLTLATLGFRGEALPSIASVSRFTLATREREHIEGTEIYVEGGRVKEVKARGMAEGTVIEVRNLFFNTPARLKFMKSAETEAGHVGDLLTKLAISRPDIRFTYLSDGRAVFRVLQGELRDRVASLLGKTIADSLYPVKYDAGGLTVSGLVARPECSRSGASHLYTYINGRFIRDRVVHHAILQAYRSFLERGRYPVAALFIDMPECEVDVNVHPTKHEVRFREQGKVHDNIQAAVESVLRNSPWLERTASVAASPAFLPETSPCDPASTKVAEVRDILANYRPTSQPLHHNFPLPSGRTERAESSGPTGMPVPATTVTDGYFCGLTVIGQYNAAYILCQDEGDLVIIDQHAAHERVAFERLKAQFSGGRVESQGLLFPETVEVSPGEGALLKEYRSEIARLGYELEEFGGATWLLKGAPRLLAGGNYLGTLRDIMEELHTIGRSRGFVDKIEDILSRIACHSVVRGAHLLTAVEIAALFRQMDKTEFAANCPHGRPALRKITLTEIERMFKRG